MRTPLAALALISIGAPANADPLSFYNGRLFIDATISGIRTEALLDSAAEATLVDPALAAKAKLPQGTPKEIRGSAGSAAARIVKGARIRAIGTDLRPDAIVVADLGELSKKLIKRPTSMVIGRELFDALRLRIDIQRGSIDAVGRGERPSGTALGLTRHAGIEAIPATANGNLVHAEFDLGNGSKPLISRELASRLDLKPVGRETGGGIGGEVKRDIVVIPTLKVAEMTFRNVHAAIDDQSNANDLNLGTSILKNFLITTDFKHKLVWLSPFRRT